MAVAEGVRGEGMVVLVRAPGREGMVAELALMEDSIAHTSNAHRRPAEGLARSGRRRTKLLAK